jgi:hypothetical protein
MYGFQMVGHLVLTIPKLDWFSIGKIGHLVFNNLKTDHRNRQG